MAADVSGVRVLVTGASGFIGRPAVTALLDAGVEVHAVARRVPDDRGGLPAAAWHAADLLEDEAVERVMAAVKPTHLLHLAWEVTPGLYQTSPGNLAWAAASLRLAESFARAGGRRLVVAGTSSEYSTAAQRCVESETAIVPQHLYAASKHAVHQVLERWSEQTGVSVAWGRVFYLHGPREAAPRLVPQLVRAAASGTTFGLRFPDQIRDYLHVADVGRGLAALLRAPVTGAVNIASGRGVTLREIAAIVGAHVGRDVRLGAAAAEADPLPAVVGDAARLHSDVGVVPTFSLASGLQDSVAWWMARGPLVVT